MATRWKVVVSVAYKLLQSVCHIYYHIWHFIYLCLLAELQSHSQDCSLPRQDLTGLYHDGMEKPRLTRLRDDANNKSGLVVYHPCSEECYL